jgi:hypothetical protein
MTYYLSRRALATEYGLDEKLIRALDPPDKIITDSHNRNTPLYDRDRVKEFVRQNRKHYNR